MMLSQLSRTAVAVVGCVVVLGACSTTDADLSGVTKQVPEVQKSSAAEPPDAALRRTTITVNVEGRGELRMDLTATPPVMDPNYDPAAGLAAVDVEAAAALRNWVFDLQEADRDCPAAVVPRLDVEVWVLPPPEIAERADLASYAFAGPCRDVSSEELQQFVSMWNAAGGNLQVGQPN